ncbi:SubName: Full=Uncharacterized protein {ECO:0000313/EMBL:CCA76096.1} [Serendipita indica DSM 11827]|nr:SubName: Full=Uncharacterized protein {ECO:0000313/EMBL:CCA76096.1} [Serendipita indica DSM 11827]
MPSNHPQLDSSSSKLTASSHPCSGLLHDTLGKKQHDAINKQRDLAETLELWLLFARACLQEMERKHNIRCFSTSRLPIKKCPQELLLKIFRYYLGESSHQAIANLLLVCKHWYRLVMDSPEIWACVEVDFRIGDDEAHLNALCTYAVTCMRRSKGLLLDVIIRFETLEDAMSRIEWLAYTDAGFLEEQGLAPLHSQVLDVGESDSAFRRWMGRSRRCTSSYIPPVSPALVPPSFVASPTAIPPDDPDIITVIRSAKMANTSPPSLRYVTVIAKDGTATPIDFLNV